MVHMIRMHQYIWTKMSLGTKPISMYSKYSNEERKTEGRKKAGIDGNLSTCRTMSCIWFPYSPWIWDCQPPNRELWKDFFTWVRDCRFSNSLYRFFFSSQFLCFLYVSQHLHLHNINSENGLTILSSSGCEGLVSGSPYNWDTGQHYRLFRGHKFQREFS